MPILHPSLVEEAARVDPDRTLASTFAEGPARARMLALILFNHEIAKTRESVSEPHLGAIRLAWWREAIDEIFAGRAVRAHAVVQALAGAVAEADLPREPLDAMIDARLTDFETAPFASFADLDAYADATSGHLARLSALACGAGALSLDIDRAARATGIAWTVAGLMRALPTWAGRRAAVFPADLMREVGLDAEDVFAGRTGPALSSALWRMAAHVDAAAAEARVALRATPKAAAPAFVHTTLARGHARSVLRLDDPFRLRATTPLLVRQVRLIAAILRGAV